MGQNKSKQQQLQQQEQQYQQEEEEEEQQSQTEEEELNEGILFLFQKGYIFNKYLFKSSFQDVIQTCYSTDLLLISTITIIKSADYNMDNLILYINKIKQNNYHNYFFDVKEYFYSQDKFYFYIVSSTFDFTLQEYLENQILSKSQLYDLTTNLLKIVQNLSQSSTLNCQLNPLYIGFSSQYQSFQLIDYNLNQFLNNQLINDHNNSNKQTQIQEFMKTVSIILSQVILQRSLDPIELINLNNNNLKNILQKKRKQKDFVDKVICKIIDNQISISQILQIINDSFCITEANMYELFLEKYKNQNQKEESLIVNQKNYKEFEYKLNYKSIILEIEENNFNKEAITFIQNQLNKCTRLKKIELISKITTKGSEGIELLIEGIKNFNSKIISLDLNCWGCSLTQKETQILGDYIKQCSNIKSLKLELGDNQFGDEGIDNISKSIRHLKYISSLSLQFLACRISDKGQIELGESLSQLKNLRKLELVFWANEIRNYGAKIISKSIKDCKQLTNLSLDISQNSLQQDILKEFIQPFQQMPLIQLSLRLWNNQIGDEISNFALELKKCLFLKVLRLELGANQISNQCIDIIGKQLKELPQIQLLHLDLWINNIKSEGAIQLCNHLSCCITLNSIYIKISNNKIQNIRFNQLSHIFYKKKNFINVHVKDTD